MVYDPNEARDDRGRWTAGSSSASEPPVKPYAATMMQWAKYFDDRDRHEAYIQLASANGGEQIALSPGMVPDNVERNIKNTLQAMTGLDRGIIDRIYESFVGELGFFDAMGLQGIAVHNGVVTMTQSQLDTIRSTIDDMPPDLAKTARDALEQGIRQGRVSITK